MENYLTYLIFGPIILGISLLFVRSDDRRTLLDIAMGVSAAVFLYSLKLLWDYDSAQTAETLQMVVRKPWIVVGEHIRIEYYVGIDGISLWLVMLTTFLTPITILSTATAIKKNYRDFLFAILALETFILGVFLSLDLVLFYIFWELVLIPMYALIGVWGSGDRIRSAMKFFMFTMLGSVLMFVAILVIYNISANKTFDLIRLYQDPNLLSMGLGAQAWLFWAFFAAFAIKVPLFPVHTWLPDAHTDAPTAGSVILAGLLLKLGTYGLLRFCMPLFPEAANYFAPLICVIAIIGIIYGAWVATVQPDVKRLVAYSSISHLGLVVLGLFVFTKNGVTGAMLQMINHGLTTGALFLLVGMLYERRHTRMIEDYGGIIRVMPVFGVIFWIITFASIGLPGLCNFIGEFLLILGIFDAQTTMHRIFGAFAITGVIWGAIYMLWMFQRVMLGKVKHEANLTLKDLNNRELWVLVPILALVFYIGLFSPTLTNKMDASIQENLDLAKRSVAVDYSVSDTGADESDELLSAGIELPDFETDTELVAEITDGGDEL